MAKYDVIGTSGQAIFGRWVVTGKAIYTGDIVVPGMLVGKALYAMQAHALIRRIDISAARALPGVKAVLTHKDIHGINSYQYEDTDQPVLVDKKIRYQGDVLAIVAAESEESARAALKAIVVETEALSGVFDPLEAISPDSPRIWEERDNVYKRLEYNHGDIERGFEEADYIVENVYTTPMHEHAFLETECTLACPQSDGSLLVYTTTQYPFSDQRQIARTLGIPEEQVRVVTPHIGGAFGGKDEAHVQIHAALLASATGLPVRMVRTREESIRVHVKRHPFIIRYRSGIKADGKLTAIDVDMIADTGAYADSGGTVIILAANSVGGPYSIPNARITGRAVNTNNPPCGAMRGFGMPQANFACERQMDELARAAGIDPLEIRRINGVKKGMELVTGVNLLGRSGMLPGLNSVARRAGWGKHSEAECQPEPHLRRGWGIAGSLVTFLYPRDSVDSAHIALEMAADGSVLVKTGAADMGQGTHTTLAHMAAESLGVERSAVRVMRPDTSKVLDAGSSVASRQTLISGNALLKAAGKIKKILLDVAHQETDIPRASLELRGGFLYADHEKLSISVADLAAKAIEEKGELSAEGFYQVKFPKGTFADGSFAMANGALTFGSQAAQVLVDLETGSVKVEALWIAIDAGRIIHLDGALGQVEGGTAMGFGQTVMEDLLVRDGFTLNNSLESYLIPTSMDIPPMQVDFLEMPYKIGPYGAKGIGEAAILPTAPAIVNAVCQAIGAPINSLPITAERVYRALKNRETISSGSH